MYEFEWYLNCQNSQICHDKFLRGIHKFFELEDESKVVEQNFWPLIKICSKLFACLHLVGALQ